MAEWLDTMDAIDDILAKHIIMKSDNPAYEVYDSEAANEIDKLLTNLGYPAYNIYICNTGAIDDISADGWCCVSWYNPKNNRLHSYGYNFYTVARAQRVNKYFEEGENGRVQM